MGRHFEQRNDAEVPATPDEAWAAIATGPGIDSWFLGRNDVKVGASGAGTVRTVFGEYTPELDVTEWDPPYRFGYRGGEAPDGRFIAYEFLIEGRAGGSTVLRAATSGFIPGDDWSDEYEAMVLGGELYFCTLVEYLTNFAGRFATPVTAFGPPGTSWARDRVLLCRALELTWPPNRGDRARLTAANAANAANAGNAGNAGNAETAGNAGAVGTAEGVVYFTNEHTIGVRTEDALYRFMRGFGKPLVAAHHLFAEDANPVQAGRAWEEWLARLLA